MKAKAFWQVSAVIHPESEDAVNEVFMALLGQPASICTDVETQTTRASAFLERRSDASPAKLKALHRALRQLENFGLESGSGRISVRYLRPTNWAESWKRHFKPLEIGRTLLVKPSWSRRQPKRDQALVILDPSLSFGTGQHPTTHYCLQQVAALRSQSAAPTLLDIGTGSGILAIAGAKLGFRNIEAWDFDPDAVRVARENAARNDIGRQVRWFCRDLNTVHLPDSKQWDVVCANLMADLLINQAPKIVRYVRPGGHLVTAGILQTQFAAVSKAFVAAGCKLLHQKAEKEWQSGLYLHLPQLQA